MSRISFAVAMQGIVRRPQPAPPATLVGDLLARIAVRYRSVPVIFPGSRKLAEEWTDRFLAAAYAEAVGEQRFGDDPHS